MAIEIRCPNGHFLRVKDEYAGKTGLCPSCRARVRVPVPKQVQRDETFPWDEDVLQDGRHGHTGEESGLIPTDSSSYILKKVKICPKCSFPVSQSFSICPTCGTPLPSRIVELL